MNASNDNRQLRDRAFTVMGIGVTLVAAVIALWMLLASAHEVAFGSAPLSVATQQNSPHAGNAWVRHSTTNETK